MGIKNSVWKRFAPKYHMQCVKILTAILKSETKKPLDKADKENLLKAMKLVNSMSVGDKFLNDIPISKKMGKVLRNKIKLAKVGICAVDDLIRDLEYESYPYHIFFKRVLRHLRRVKEGKKTNFGLLTSFFGKLKDKFYVPSHLCDSIDL